MSAHVSTMNGLSLAAVGAIQQLKMIAADIAAKPAGGRFGGSMQDDEWRSYSTEFRLCAVMISGIDGDTAALVHQRWQKFTPPERDALASALRSLRRGASKVRACAL